jgi:hypothetical protein
MNPETIGLIIDVVAAFGRRIADAFMSDDDAEIQRLADVLDEPLKSKVVQQHGVEKMRRAYRDDADGNG